MAWMFATGACVACGTLFQFNPDSVPSIRVRFEAGRPVPDPAGQREPVCRSCFQKWNQIRKAKGEPEMVEPRDAYEAQR